MRRAGVPPILVGMTHAAAPHRKTLIAVAAAILLMGAVAAIVVWDPVGSLVRGVDLPDWASVSALPDLPRWLLWALGKVKFAVIAVVALVVIVRELRRARGA
jgi:hypothetical protein